MGYKSLSVLFSPKLCQYSQCINITWKNKHILVLRYRQNLDWEYRNSFGSKNHARKISTSNYMLGRAICDKLPECIFENLEIARVKEGQFQNF